MKKSVILSIGISCLASTAARAETPPTLQLTLAPHSNSQRVEYVDIDIKLQDPKATVGVPFLLAPEPVHEAGSPSYLPSSLRITDRKGKLNFTTGKDYKISPARNTDGDVTIHYRAPAHVINKFVFPPYELRAEGQSALGAGMAFLITPFDDVSRRTVLNWDMSNMPKGSFGVWSFGEGNLEHVGNSDDLTQSFFAMGPLLHYSRGAAGLYWASEPPFDAQGMGKAMVTLFDYYTGFFRHKPDSFRAFLRKNATAGSAGALTQSFLFDYNSSRLDPGTMKDTLAHEMAHTFIGTAPEGRWFDEGMANHYAGRLGMRAGVLSPGDFLAALNKDSLGYYTSPVREISIADADKNEFGTDDAIDDIYYRRSRIILGALDSMIRKKSAGKRSLDDLTLLLSARSRSAEPERSVTLADLIERELGVDGVAFYRSAMAGHLVVPDPDTYGPCFTRQRIELREFDLGFDRSILRAKPAIIKGLRTGSPGDHAGLKDGDEILSSDFPRSFSEDPTAKVTLKVKREGVSRDVSYTPRNNRQIEGYKWVRMPTVPDNACAI